VARAVHVPGSGNDNDSTAGFGGFSVRCVFVYSFVSMYSLLMYGSNVIGIFIVMGLKCNSSEIYDSAYVAVF